MADEKDKTSADISGGSPARSGEEVAHEEGPDAGRERLGRKGASKRPVGRSTARDFTGIDPQDPITKDELS